VDIGIAGIMAAKPNEPPMQTLRKWLAELEAAIAANDRATIKAVLKDAVPESVGLRARGDTEPSAAAVSSSLIRRGARAFSVPIESEPGFCSVVFDAFLYANRRPLRSKNAIIISGGENRYSVSARPACPPATSRIATQRSAARVDAIASPASTTLSAKTSLTTCHTVSRCRWPAGS